MQRTDVHTKQIYEARKPEDQYSVMIDILKAFASATMANDNGE